MAGKGDRKTGRDGRTSQFILVKSAEKKPATTVVETVKRSGKK